MKSVKILRELQAAIADLSRKEFWKLARWFDEKRNEVWDQEMEEDARPGGPLDKLARKAIADHKAGLTLPLEEVLSGGRKSSNRRKRSRPK